MIMARLLVLTALILTPVLTLFAGTDHECGRLLFRRRGQDYPWMVLIVDRNDQEKFICSGTLISRGAVLTSGFCVSNMTADRLTVKMAVNGEDRDVTSIVIAESYIFKSYPVNDMAVLLLQTDMPDSGEVSTLCLPVSQEVYDETECFLIKLNMKGEKYERVKMPLFEPDVCEAVVQSATGDSAFRLETNSTCAGGVDAQDNYNNQLDGGAPLVCQLADTIVPPRYTQVGILSWRFHATTKAVPSIFANIGENNGVLPWIRKTVNKERGE